MFTKNKFSKLTSREVDIMNILWASEKPLIASEIADSRPDLTVNTVQAVLRKLLKYQLIEVADIVYSGTVLSRSYRPTITSEEFALHEVTSDYLAFQKTLSKPLLVSALLDTEKDPVKTRETIDELQKMLDEYKKKLRLGAI
ncbi:BlaI/MecI/CopY family transcriptional regulator [Blautia sp.]